MHIIGLMSGTSLDGIDVAYCHITSPHECHLLAADTYPYTAAWEQRLRTLPQATAEEYALTDVALGHLFGQLVQRFRQEHPGEVDLIASHGHTVFHQPQHRLTAQIGCGDAIAAETQLPVAFNFRALDVALGGEGAPLVPIGDELLFGDYDACLNLGGIANISFREQGLRRAFDISPCNMAINHLAQRLGLKYDPEGHHASQGETDETLLHQMDALPYYSQSYPKSLGKEWFDAQFLPLLSTHVDTHTLLRTVVQHIGHQVSSVVQQHQLHSMLVTGGGAHNRFLMQQIRACCPACNVQVPATTIVDYKEAMVFALLGYLRVTHHQNVLPSVTGANKGVIGGDISGLFPR